MVFGVGAVVFFGVAFGVTSSEGAGAGTGPGAVTFTASAMSTGMIIPAAIISDIKHNECVSAGRSTGMRSSHLSASTHDQDRGSCCLLPNGATHVTDHIFLQVRGRYRQTMRIEMHHG